MSYTINTRVSWAQSMRELGDEMKIWGIKEWAVNSPRGAKWEGWREQSLLDRMVRLTYYKNDKPITLEMGKQTRAVDNLRVLLLAIHDMRMNEKRGLSEVLESAYMQLAAPASKRNPYEVLGLMPDAPIEVAEASYKARARVAHPDNGGSVEQMKELNEAIKQIREAKKL